jgi:AraC-like DNA-binding protein
MAAVMRNAMAQFAAREVRADVEPGGPPSRTRLFDLSVGLVEDVRERGMVCEGAESFSPRFQLALPYRGFFVWHVGGDDVAGDANQAIFVTGGEEYRMSHPVRGGYAELIFTPAEWVVSELADATRGGLRAHASFRRRSRCLDLRLQCFRARFLSWANGSSKIDSLEAEELVLSLLRWALAEEAPLHPPAPSTRRLLVRTKAYLESQLAQPIHLTDVGRAIGASPAYLTDLFRRVEGVPLHRYLTQLRLARALVELPHTDDLTALALDVGFSSHSHFSASFHRAFRMTPTEFRRTSRGRVRPPVI